MRMPEPTIQRQMEPEEEREIVQRKAMANQVTPLEQQQEFSEIPPTVHEVLRSPGQPLDPTARAFMEPRFGYDFSQVRVHSGAAAERSAKDVSARAYTVGNNIVFGAKQFAPGSTEGRRLLAHELTHVIQQGGADSTIVPQEDSETGDSTLQKHKTSANDEIVGDISRQAIPKLSSGLMLQRAACPCCADSISIGNISRIDNATHMGHSFDVNLGLGYPASGPTGSCTLEWWEKTNVPAIPGHAPNTWTDMYALYAVSPTFDPWKNRSENCGSSSPVTITDPPSLGRTPGRTVTRTLEFRIVINSMPPTSEGGCAAASQQVTAKQVLTMVSGAPDWAASSFTTP
ncbi:MAG: DUF4157 domain-containing protein [Leptolyngbyaceae cyanobacterium RM1_405_57]|nr:DUF4157 domain-containing protein [Leptolyngbyaceae cyanobacterium RM1_405_57]